MSLLTGKYVSVERIIETVFREYPIVQELNWTDALEYIGDCIDLIGVNRSYITKITDGNTDLGHPNPIMIQDYRGELPCDLVKVDQVRDYNSKSVMLYATDSFHKNQTRPIRTSSSNGLTSDYGQSSLQFSSDLAQASTTVNGNSGSLTYNLNNNYIFTNFEEGCVEMVYTAFPTDKNGFPLIPDDIKFIRACVCYVAEREAFKLWLMDKLADGKYNKILQDRMFYIGAANTRGNMPNKDAMESMKNQWIRLVPNINEHSNSFKYLNEGGKLKIHNAY
jgi:hypothetical protein